MTALTDPGQFVEVEIGESVNGQSGISEARDSLRLVTRACGILAMSKWRRRRGNANRGTQPRPSRVRGRARAGRTGRGPGAGEGGGSEGKIALCSSGELETDGVPSGRLEIVLRPRRLSELCPARQVECLSVRDQSAADTAISAENISPVLTATGEHAASHARRPAARPHNNSQTPNLTTDQIRRPYGRWPGQHAPRRARSLSAVDGRSIDGWMLSVGHRAGVTWTERHPEGCGGCGRERARADRLVKFTAWDDWPADFM